MMKRSFSTLLLCLLSATAAVANDLAKPEGHAILTISGDIAQTNMNDTLQFDQAMLQDLDATVIETSTIWTDGVRRFQGVSLNTLTELLEVDAGTLKAMAINDYSVQIPVSDATEDGPIIAYLMDGNPMSVREKGPLWIIYPFDSASEFRSEVIYSELQTFDFPGRRGQAVLRIQKAWRRMLVGLAAAKAVVEHDQPTGAERGYRTSEPSALQIPAAAAQLMRSIIGCTSRLFGAAWPCSLLSNTCENATTP